MQHSVTASSGPGVSLMQEGMSYLAGAELPCVIVDVVRAGPGLGNIAPEQSDYFAMVKGGGHGNYRNIVLAPASVQEMAAVQMERHGDFITLAPRLLGIDLACVFLGNIGPMFGQDSLLERTALGRRYFRKVQQ